MPKQKDLKRVVRARMQKTGEAYTTARLHIVKKQPPVSTPLPDYAALARMSDASVKKATGCEWHKWVTVLDEAGGKEMSHHDLALHIHEKYHTPDWWSQMVAVGYERIHGLRAHGQRRSGDWSVNKSKTVAVPLATLYTAFSNARRRARWLPGVKLTIRTATANKSMRIRWEDGTPIDVGFYPRGETKSQVTLDHQKLRTKEEADRLRLFWSERFEVLAAMMKQ